MSDYVRLERGQYPWKPTLGSDLSAVFDEYDMPLEGVIRQDGCSYLFECLAGRMAPTSIWMFTHIQPTELAELEQVAGAEYDTLVSQIQRAHPATVAVALRDEGLLAWVDASDVSEGLMEPLTALRIMVHQFAERVAQSSGDLDELGSLADLGAS
jgi:hypothetical protein